MSSSTRDEATSESDSEDERKRQRQPAYADRWRALTRIGPPPAKIIRPKRGFLSFPKSYPQTEPLPPTKATTIGVYLSQWIDQSLPQPPEHHGWPYDRLQDSIQVLIDVHEFVHVDKKSIWADPITFTLRLTFIAPPSTGFLIFYSKSPTFSVATYFGDSDDHYRPEWVDYRYRPTPPLWIPRPLAIEVARGNARLECNEGVREDAIRWCENMMRGSFADLHTRDEHQGFQAGKSTGPESPGPHPASTPLRPSRRHGCISLASPAIPSRAAMG